MANAPSAATERRIRTCRPTQQTYFRYTTPNIIEVLKVNDELKELQAYRDSLVTDVEGVPGPWKTTKSASTPT